MPKYTIGLAAICCSLLSSPALAQSAQSSGYAVDVDQTVTVPNVATVNVGVGPLAATAGNAPPSYNEDAAVASVNQTLNLTTGPLGVDETLQTGLLTSNSNGTATGAQATATINDFSVALAGLTDINPLLFSLSATTIQSFSQANTVGGFDASGGTIIEGLVLGGSVFGSLIFDGSLFVNPDPNTVLFSGAGLSIILNEQILSGSGIETNAIHIAFNDFALGTGLKNGDIILAHTEAFATGGTGQPGAVPEPATWAMMLMGFGATGAAMRRRRKAALRKALAT